MEREVSFHHYRRSKSYSQLEKVQELEAFEKKKRKTNKYWWIEGNETFLRTLILVQHSL